MDSKKGKSIIQTRNQKKRLLNISDITSEISHFNSTLADGTILDLSSKSVPSLSEVDSTLVADLKQQLIDLRNELDGAHEEITKLNLECSNLKRESANKTCQLATLKKISDEQVSLSPRNTPRKMSAPAASISSQLTNIKRRLSRHTPINNGLRISPIKKDSPPQKPTYRKLKVTNTTNQGGAEHQLSYSLTEGNQLSNETAILSSTQNHACDAVEKIPKEREREMTTHNVKTVDKRHKVLILADETGRGMGKRLQKLLGENYVVTAIVKPNATMDQVLSSGSILCKYFSKSDFVIIMAGSNDTNPLNAQAHLYYTIGQLKTTNVLMGKIYKNKYLNVHSLNDMMRHACKYFSNSEFVALDDQDIALHFDKTTASKLILRDILRITYRNNYADYRNKKQYTKVKKPPSVEKACQTEPGTKFYSHQETQTDDALQAEDSSTNSNNNHNNLFRV